MTLFNRKPCPCNTLLDRYWYDLRNTVADRHGVKAVTYDDVRNGLTAEDKARALVIAELENAVNDSDMDITDVVDRIASYCNLPPPLTPAEEMEELVKEIVGPQELQPFTAKALEEAVS